MSEGNFVVISRVIGTLVAKEIDRVEVATAGGVVYELDIPASVYERLPGVGDDVQLHCALIGREDGLELFGFATELERRLFLRLQSASGVGPRLALTLLGSLAAERLIEAIRGRDLSRLQTVSGVGKKKAERIVVELADKLDDMAGEAIAARPEGARAEAAVRALVALGYTQSAAESAVRGALKAVDGKGTDVEALVRRALAGLS